MTRSLCILLLTAAGCTGAASVLEEVPPELRKTTAVVPPAADRHPYADPSGVEVGRWASYREDGRTFTLAVAGREAEGTWVELIEEGAASARLVAPDGAVLRALYQENGGPAQPQPLEQRAGVVAAKRSESGRESGTESVRIAGRELAAKRVRIVSEDLEGRRAEEIWIWHPEVPPLYAGGEDGGLVRRESGGRKTELLDFGAGAAPRVKR